jgi:hypothetical protein
MFKLSTDMHSSRSLGLWGFRNFGFKISCYFMPYFSERRTSDSLQSTSSELRGSAASELRSFRNFGTSEVPPTPHLVSYERLNWRILWRSSLELRASEVLASTYTHSPERRISEFSGWHLAFHYSSTSLLWDLEVLPSSYHVSSERRTG